MQWEYKVVLAQEAIKKPSNWQMPASWAKEYASRMEVYLNEMASDGWEYLSSCNEPYVQSVYLFFRRAKAEVSTGPAVTGIKEL